jgi:hypothetical protein
LRPPAHRRRANQLKLARSIRLLACEFLLVSDCEQLVEALDSLVPHASQTYPVSRCHRFEAFRIDNGYRLRVNDKDVDTRPDAGSAAADLYTRMHELALQALPEFTRIHAGCASRHGKRVVAAGPARAGKTTLMTRLLFESFAVHCDDTILLNRGYVLPYPRRFRIRWHAMPLLPQIAPFAARARETRDHLALDPTELGFEWRIDAAPADVVLFLEPNHGSPSRLVACPKYSMANLIMSQSNLPAGGAHEWVRDVCAMVDKAATYVLRCGTLDSAVEAVKEALDPATAQVRREGETE